MVDTTKVLFMKKEVAYAGVTSGLISTTSYLTRRFQAKPVVVDQIDRNIDRSVRGATKTAPSNARQTFGFELEIAGSGAAGTAPAWMEALEMCGMAAPVLVATTSATQAFLPIGTALSSGVAKHYHGTQQRTANGVRGTFGFDFTAGSYPFWKLDMTGLLVATPLDDIVPVTPNLTRWKDPLEVNTANTDFLLGGYAAVLRSFTGDVAADIKARNLVGGNYVNRGNHKITGKIVCEAPNIATKNYFATLQSGAEIPAQIVHGVTAGTITQIDMSTIQITDVELTEEDDTLMLSMTYQANAGSAPDDMIITAK